MSRRSITGQALRETSSTQAERLGVIAETDDGRLYRYAEAAGTALDPGKLTVNDDLVANHTNIAVAEAASVGARKVKVTLGATAVSAGDYQDGWLNVNDAAGEGINYKITGHSAASASAELTVLLDERLEVALTTSSEVTLVPNTYKDIVVSATDQADQPTGVPNVTIAADEFGWVQTHGDCAVLADEAVTKGQSLTIGTGVAGAVEAADLIGEPIVGYATHALVDTEHRTAYLTID